MAFRLRAKNQKPKMIKARTATAPITIPAIAPAPRAGDDEPAGEMDVFEFGELVGEVDALPELRSGEAEVALLFSRLDEVALLEDDDEDEI